MSATESGNSQQQNEDTIEQGATPLELLFDLIFVFAFTQVTSFLSDHLTLRAHPLPLRARQDADPRQR